MNFTDRWLKSVSVQNSERSVFSDTGQPNLLLRVSSKSKVFYCDYRFQGKRHRFKIGPYPSISIKDARSVVRKVLLDIGNDVDPRPKISTNLPTVSDAFTEYEIHHLKNLKAGKERARTLKKELGELWNIPTTRVARDDLEQILRKKRAAGVTGNRIRAYIRAFFQWVYVNTTMMPDGNPAAILTKPEKEKPRNRVLKMEEIREIFEASGELPAVRLLILTGARRSEIVDLKWSEVDLQNNRIELSGERTKNGEHHIIPLSKSAKQILLEQDQTNMDGLVFQNRNLNRVKQYLPRLDEPWKLHDFRRAFATHMSERGVAAEVVELSLGHKFKGIMGVYNRAERIPDRVRALDKWADIIFENEATVVNLHAG